MVAETTATPRHRNNDNLASNFERASSGTDAPLAISSMWILRLDHVLFLCSCGFQVLVMLTSCAFFLNEVAIFCRGVSLSLSISLSGQAHFCMDMVVLLFG